jgi:hypothetical protein
MLRTCQADSCETLTMGTLCLDHEPPAPPRQFPRGRPYRPAKGEVTARLRRIEETWPLAGQVQLRSLSPS